MTDAARPRNAAPPAVRRVGPGRAGRIAALAVGTVLVAGAAGIAAGEAAGWRFLRDPIARAASAAAGVPVTLEGDFRLRLLWRPGLDAGHLRIGAAQDVPVGHLLEAEGLRLRWDRLAPWQAWRRADDAPLPPLRRLEATRLDANLVRLADGRASWRLGGPERAPGSTGDDAPPPASSRIPSIDTLQVGTGMLRLIDEPLQTQAVIHAHTEARALQVSAAGRHRGHTVEIEGRADDALGWLDERTALQLSGRYGSTRLTYQGRLGDALGRGRLDGRLTLRGPSLADFGHDVAITLPRTAPFALGGRLRHDDGRWRLDDAAFRTGDTRLAGSFALDLRPERPHLSGDFDGGVLRLTDLGPAIGTPAAGGAAAAAADDGRVLPDRPFDLPSLSAMTADVGLRLDRFDFGGDSLGEGSDLRARVRLDDGVLRVDDLRVDVAGGRFAGRSQLDGRDGRAQWRLDLDWTGLALDRWILALQREPGRTPWATGRVDGSARLAGDGRSTAGILSTLDGRIESRLREATVSHLAVEAVGLDLAQALGVAIGGDESLTLRCARVAMKVDDGVAQLTDAVADNADSTLRAIGTVDLGDERLDLVARARPKDLSPLSLRGPVHVDGTLAHPSWRIDGRALGGRLAAAAALAALAPPAALLAFVDPGSAPTEDPCAKG